jgi:hydroxyethylthiazole kinase-like uncharacterized protein yjeF
VIALSLGSFGRVSLPDGALSSLFLPSSAEMANLDARTIRGGIASRELMERAGARVAEFIAHRVSLHPTRSPHVVIVCGPGNNGGDGLVISRWLSAHDISCSTVIAQAGRYSPEFVEQLLLAREALIVGTKPEPLRDANRIRTISTNDFRSELAGATIIVDALLGTGQSAAPRGDIASLVAAIEECRRDRSDIEVVSVDIPTGTNPDTGAVYEPCVKADHTVCIELIKRGLMQFPARERCGEIVAIPIGISDRAGVEFVMAEAGAVPRIQRRGPNAHKGIQGRVLVIGGSAAMPGASALAVLGALRVGAGLVSRSTKATWTGADLIPECMHVNVSGDTPHFVEEDCDELVEAIAQADSVVLGPGLGRSRETGRFVQGCLNSIRLMGKRAIIDADALTLMAVEGLDARGIEGIITPHPGEAASMLDSTPQIIQGDRFAAVKALRERFGLVTLLKGAGTLVWNGAQGSVVARGTPYLATAGSGDILSGILATSCIGCKNLYDAAVQGAYIHAVAGERAAQKTGGPIVASDIAFAAASVIGDLES